MEAAEKREGERDRAVQVVWTLTRDFDVYTVAMILEREVADLVYEQGFEGGVKEGRVLEPSRAAWKLFAIDQETSEKQTARGKGSAK